MVLIEFISLLLFLLTEKGKTYSAGLIVFKIISVAGPARLAVESEMGKDCGKTYSL